jgi:hypothetical protein
LQLIRRIRALEKQMVHYGASARAQAIRTRLGLGRSRYYELRKLALSPETGPDSGEV